MDWLVNSEQRKFYPADYAPGESMPPVEGLPVLSPANSLENGSDNPNSSTNQGMVNRLTPLTDGNIPTPSLGMPADEAIKIWHSEGSPIIHLGPGENCSDLEKLVTGPMVDPDHLQAVKDWLDKVTTR
jgi:hypothetical protein